MTGYNFLCKRTGSNIGTESFYAGLTHSDLEVHGYDLLCDFVDIANDFKKRFEVDNVHFHCQDALTADISDTMVVFLDDQAWDSELVKLMFTKLENQLPVGGILFDYVTAHEYAVVRATPKEWELIACESLDVSWMPMQGTSIAVYRKLPHNPSFLYNNLGDYMFLMKR